MKQDTIDAINAFRDERSWRQFHNPKDMAISICLEAAELLELFQWKRNEEVVDVRSEQMRDELADILTYCVMMATDLGFDLDEIIRDKLSKNAIKYPVEKCQGKKTKYSELGL